MNRIESNILHHARKQREQRRLNNLNNKTMKIIITHEFQEERTTTFLILTAYFKERTWTRKYLATPIEDAKKHFKNLIKSIN